MRHLKEKLTRNCKSPLPPHTHTQPIWALIFGVKTVKLMHFKKKKSASLLQGIFKTHWIYSNDEHELAPTKVIDNIKQEIFSIDCQIHDPWGLECSQIKACLYRASIDHIIFGGISGKWLRSQQLKHNYTFLMIMFRYDEHDRLWWLSAPGVIHTPTQ